MAHKGNPCDVLGGSGAGPAGFLSATGMTAAARPVAGAA